MAANYETKPYQGEPDEFDFLVSEITEFIADPRVTGVHKKALQCQKEIQLEGPPGSEDHDYACRQYASYLDDLWGEFNGEPMHIGGWAWRAGEKAWNQCIAKTK